MIAKAELKILPWGNNLAVRIPVAVARAAHLVSGQTVSVENVEGGILVRPQASKPALSLAQKLKRFDPQRHGGELMDGAPVGAELSGW
jgi:antitoxin MazE